VRTKATFFNAASGEFVGSQVEFMAGSSNVDPDFITKRSPGWFRI